MTETTEKTVVEKKELSDEAVKKIQADSEKELNAVKQNNKFWLVCIGVVVLVGLITFGITYAIRSKQIDEEFRQAFDGSIVEEVDNHQIVGYTITYNDKEYKDAVLLIGEIKEPVTLKIRIQYQNGDIVDKEAYVSFNPDKSITTPDLKDGDYVQIILPSLEAEIPTFKEFLDEAGVVEDDGVTIKQEDTSTEAESSETTETEQTEETTTETEEVSTEATEETSETITETEAQE